VLTVGGGAFNAKRCSSAQGLSSQVVAAAETSCVQPARHSARVIITDWSGVVVTLTMLDHLIKWSWVWLSVELRSSGCY